MTTLKEISRRSGFSVTTVSRALNGHHDVMAETRAKIEAVARALNYSPNQVARKLVLGRSGMVGLVLARPPAPFEQGHFFHIISGSSQAFSARDMDFVLHVGTGGDPMATYRRLVSRGTLDGFIVTAPELRDPRITLLKEHGVPFVVHGLDPTQDGYAFFDLDNAAVSASAVDHLAALGHRRIALINGPETWAYAVARCEGFRAALARHDLPEGPVLHGDTSEVYGAAALAHLMAMSQRPTAVVCCNTLVAKGVYSAAAEAGLSIPRDLSVFAHDDGLPQAPMADFDPPLSGTACPLSAAVETLAELLVRAIAGEPPAGLRKLDKAWPVAGRSTARPVV